MPIVDALFCLLQISATPEGPKAVESLVAAERAFAKRGIEQGVKASFLASFAEDSVLFRPGPVSALRWLREHPDPGVFLAWAPSFAELATSGDFGWTTGPWELRARREDPEPGAFGHFLSVWRRQPDGEWKVILDYGVDHPQPKGSASLTTSALGPSAAQPNQVQDLKALDLALTAAAQVKGPREALRAVAATDLRSYRRGGIPTQGSNAIEALPMLAWSPAASGCAASGDLGFTYGTATFAESGATATYVHIWRRAQGVWTLAADMLVSQPAR